MSAQKMSRKAKIWVIALSSLVALVIAGLIAFPFVMRKFFEPTPSNVPTGQTTETLNVINIPPAPVDEPAPVVEPLKTITTDLDIPWELVFLPDGDMLVTERPGNLLRVGVGRTVIPIEGVQHQGEGGLLGLALHPDFMSNNLIYLYLTTRSSGGLTNRVEQYRLQDDQLFDKKIILEEIPGASFHDGGRIAFGPDKLLYITTGDAGNESLAQDTSSLAGKILRLNPDGSVPADNPFGNAVYSYGHRNPQGITWDEQDQLWSSEHGPSGLAPNSGQDELNLIEKGKNYGWPTVRGDQTQSGLESPIIHSGVDDTWAPGGAVYIDGSIFFAGLRGEALYEAKISGASEIDLVAHFKEEFGRLRSVTLGPDGLLYVLTSNTDGRGTEKPDDDKIIRIDPNSL